MGVLSYEIPAIPGIHVTKTNILFLLAFYHPGSENFVNLMPAIASFSALKEFPLCFCERFTTARMAKVVKDRMSVLSQKHTGNCS